MVTSICGTIVAIIGLIIGIYKIWFSKDAKQDKWKKELYELELKMDEAYLAGDEQLHRTLIVKHELLLREGSAFGFKR